MAEFAQPFAELGGSIEAAFRKADYAERRFAEIAAEHVERARLHERFDIEALARWALSARDLPSQEDIDARFGDPPVTLWNGRRFFVSAILWGSSTTSIHQHSFTGAFQVLHGSSVHARYRFTPEHEVSEDLAAGKLGCTAIEHLTAGATRPIPAAHDGIHSLFHLQHPSVSLVVRTHADHRHPIQFAYYPPGLAIWDQRGEPAPRRARQVAAAMLGFDAARAETLLAEALRASTGYDAFWLLEDARRIAGLATALRLVEHCRAALHPAVFEAFDLALKEEDRRAALSRRREQVRDPALRYFLAALLNAQSLGDVLSLARAYAPARAPNETVVGWLAELAGVRMQLQAAGEPWTPNVFGLPDPDGRSLDALRTFLSGGPETAAGDAPFYAAVRRSPAFAPLFRA